LRRTGGKIRCTIGIAYSIDQHSVVSKCSYRGSDRCYSRACCISHRGFWRLLLSIPKGASPYYK
jgi:hypothetical protein